MTRLRLPVIVRIAVALACVAVHDAAACVDDKGRAPHDVKGGEVAMLKCGASDRSARQIAPNRPLDASRLNARQRQILQEAERAEREKDYRTAVRHYKKLGNAGHGPSAKRLGEIYDRGAPGITRDYAQSLSWYQRAQKLGENVEAAGKR